MTKIVDACEDGKMELEKCSVCQFLNACIRHNSTAKELTAYATMELQKIVDAAVKKSECGNSGCGL